MSDDSCPLPYDTAEVITRAHGAASSPMQQLIHRFFQPLYGQGFAPDHDGAVFDLPGRLAFSTDSYVISPLFFPGGDIGSLAIYGTVNDLAMCGATPRYLSCAFILEEGFPLASPARVCRSMTEAAQEAKVAIVTGDTKVVGLFRFIFISL